MSELSGTASPYRGQRWRVTGPDGFEKLVEAPDKESAVVDVWRCVPWLKLALQAGYRAEPIKEPKMVTVRAEDVEAAIGERGFRTMDEFRCAMARLRAALEPAK